jgi:serine/threonine-protein kinase
MSGKWIWPFELLDKLGEGGMGEVYRARYVGNDRIVAVKLLPDEVAKNPTLVARFDRELEILKQLRHPNIVHCFGGLTESQRRFYAMEYIDGGTLAQQLRAKGRFAWHQVIDLGVQICAALEYAHDKGVIHRDLKPANFLMSKGGKLKLSDFGLATIVAGQRLTVAGKTAGTFLYMAPEQIRGKPPLSNRTDLYALGCVLYELLTGRPPYDAEVPATVLHKHLKDPIPHVSAEVMDCPPELDRLIVDLLQKDPELRPASAKEVELRLQGILRPSLTNVDPYSRTPAAPVTQIKATVSDGDLDAVPFSSGGTRRAWPWIGLACGLTLLAAWGWWSSFAAARSGELYLESWVVMARRPGPGQIPAIEQLGRFPRLPPEILDRLYELAETPGDDGPRVAALQALAAHPETSLSLKAKLLKLERDEPNPTVRSQAGATRTALEAATETNPKDPTWGWWPLILLGGLLAGAGFWVWRSIRPAVASPSPAAAKPVKSRGKLRGASSP